MGSKCMGDGERAFSEKQTNKQTNIFKVFHCIEAWCKLSNKGTHFVVVVVLSCIYVFLFLDGIHI